MQLTLSLLTERFAICRLDSQMNIPNWALLSKQLVSITRTEDELSILCEHHLMPETLVSEKDWRALKLEGPLDFSLVGVLNKLTEPLAHANVSIFVISTFDTDYILVKEEHLSDALRALEKHCTFKG